MKCPLCGKEMIQMDRSVANSPLEEPSRGQETLYYCEKHGVINKSTDLREKVDQIAKRA